jgi:predicted ATPase/DNA-binding SARP family transcriptional activator
VSSASDAPPRDGTPADGLPPDTARTAPASPPAPPLAHTVPAALSGFVGRARDLAGVGELLGRARVLTLAGPGGVGKTRLAREAAAREAAGGEAAAAADHAPRFPDGVWWVELAPLPPGADPAPAVAAALGVRPPLGADRPDAMVDALAAALAGPAHAPRRLLLVLDNCEHVVEGAATLADLLLRRCPGLTLLATSREALGVEGETVWPVAGLAHPPAARRGGAHAAAEAREAVEVGHAPAVTPPADAADAAFAAGVAEYDAVRLFVARAQAAHPAFALTARTAPAVAAICARLDGLPLALELAAAQVGTVGVESLATRLDDVFAVLTRGRRTALPRHRTLRALLDWSYHLLGDAERALLAQLSVFRGPFPVEAVESVCADASTRADVLTVLGRLVEQSLVDVRESDGEVRYRLLETVRQYGRARLGESPAEERRVRARHAAWVAALAGAAVDRAWSAARGRTVARLADDVDEIRAALEWAASADGDPMTGVRIAGALAWFWYSGVPWGEARARTAAALAAADAQGIADAARPPADQAALAALCYPMSGLAYFAGEPDAMLAAGRRAAALWEAVRAAAAADPAFARAVDPALLRGRTITWEQAGHAHAMRGEFDDALAAMDAAVDLAAGRGDRRAGDGPGGDRPGGDRWLHAVMLMRRALVAAAAGRFAQAVADYEASVPALRAVGETWFLSLALEGMAVVALVRGELAAAAAHARESAAVLRREPDAWFVSRALDTLAAIVLAAPVAPPAVRARAQHAARLMGSASALRARCGADVIAPDRPRYDATRAAAAAALGDAFDAAWNGGLALDLHGAFALAADTVVAPPAAPAPPVDGAPDGAPADGAPADGAPADAGPLPRAAAGARSDERSPAAGPGGPVVAVRLFGPLAVARDGAPVPATELTPAKVRELLLYLVLHPAGRTKEQIALALWPDAAPAQLRNAFHVTMHQLRRALGHKSAVTFDGGAYALARVDAARADGRAADDADGGADAVVHTDVDAVLAAADAVRAADRAADRARARGADAVAAVGADAAARARWRTALLPAERGALGEGEDAGEWLAPHEARVRAAWAEAMEALARLAVRAEAPGEAVAVLEALVAAEPLREGAHRC